MIKNYILNLHKKPDHHRKKVTYGVSAGLTLVIGLVWFSSFGYFHNIQNGTSNSNQVAFSSNNTASVSQANVVSNNKDANNGPLSVMGSNLSNAYQGIRSAIGFHSGDSNKNATATLEYVPDR